MRWLLAGCCGLALVSVALTNSLQISQSPRFYGVSINQSKVAILCQFSEKVRSDSVKWYKATEFNTEKQQISTSGQKYTFHGSNATNSKVRNSLLYIRNLQLGDKGVYFCKTNETYGPGTEVHIVRRFKYSEVLYRIKMKDGLIIFQGLLLAVCIAAILLRKRTLLEKSDSIYEEPETDHIYEGLTIETCGGGLYEELSVYAQADGAEAPWE